MALEEKKEEVEITEEEVEKTEEKMEEVDIREAMLVEAKKHHTLI